MLLNLFLAASAMQGNTYKRVKRPDTPARALYSRQSSVVVVPPVVPPLMSAIMTPLMPVFMTMAVVAALTCPVGLAVPGRWGIAVNRRRIPGSRCRVKVATTPDDIHAEPDRRVRVPGLSGRNKEQAGNEGGWKQASVRHVS
jgi:hypothetical protein